MGIDAIVVRQSSGHWLFTWPVGTPPYSVQLEGLQLASGLTIETFEYTESRFQDIAPPLEILNAGDPVENDLNPPRFMIQWRGIQAAAAYVVEQFIGGSFVEVVNVMERATGYYSWTSLPLTDQTTHLFRVIALDQFGNEGVALAFTSDITRNPTSPDVAFSISSAGDVVVAAA